MTLREAMTLLEDCHATGLVRAVDLVEVNTDLAEAAGDADLTLSAAKHVILASMGCQRSGTYQEDGGVNQSLIRKCNLFIQCCITG